MELIIKEIVKAVGGELLCGDINNKINFVSVNSKYVNEKTLFVPIKGEKVDAHDFIESAFQNGALATLTSRKEIQNHGKDYIFVNDTKVALQKLAGFYREKFTIPVIGITGSVGKTTTKEMVSSALSSGGKVLKTLGNQNSQIGVPLTIFRIDETDDFAVIEMGMSEFYEMEKISKVAKVNRAIITNIGISHIENLKTQMNICKEKLHVIDYFNENDILYLNGNDKLLKELKGKVKAKIVLFGTEDFCDYKAQNIEIYEDFTTFDLVSFGKTQHIEIPTIGEHNVLNALASIAVGIDVGLNIKQIQDGLKTFKQPSMRQQVINTGFITVIDDSYNASPDSIKSGINVLKTVGQGKRTIAVLADMLELGEYSLKAHFSLGEYLSENKVDMVITIGKESQVIIDGAKSKSNDIISKAFTNNFDAIEFLKNNLGQDDTLLIKGSRGMHTEEVVKELLKMK